MQPNQQSVKYVPVAAVETHSIVLGYLLWIIGISGAHRFYYGKPLSGVIWFFTLGLLGIGWIIDAFLIPSMNREANHRFVPGPIDYNLAWILLFLAGYLGLHRFYMGKIVTGIIYLLTVGIFGIGYIYDVLCLNTQINQENYRRQHWLN